MNRFDDQQKQTLLTVARQALEHPGQAFPGAVSDELLLEPGASFVTLTQEGQLRGCIGSLMATRALAEDVWHNAQSAAWRDPRFDPLLESDVGRTRIEVSVLTAPETLHFNNTDDLIRQVRPHIDGIVLEQGRHRATFLPQVWEQLPRPAEFFSHLLRKAGLSESTPLTDVSVQRYEVIKMEEPPG